MINIIRHISRCVYRYSSQSGLYYMRLRQTISLAPYMSRISHQLPPERTRGPYVAPSVSRLIFKDCHDNARSVTFQSGPELLYTPNVTHVQNRFHEPHYHVTIFIHGFSNQSSNTDPIVDPEEHESTFVAQDDMLPLA